MGPRQPTSAPIPAGAHDGAPSPVRRNCLIWLFFVTELVCHAAPALGTNLLDVQTLEDSSGKWETDAPDSSYLEDDKQDWELVEKVHEGAKAVAKDEKFHVPMEFLADPNDDGYQNHDPLPGMPRADVTESASVANGSVANIADRFYLADPSLSPLILRILGIEPNFSEIGKKIGALLNMKKVSRIDPGMSLHDTIDMKAAKKVFKESYDCKIIVEQSGKNYEKISKSPPDHFKVKSSKGHLKNRLSSHSHNDSKVELSKGSPEEKANPTYDDDNEVESSAKPRGERVGWFTAFFRRKESKGSMTFYLYKEEAGQIGIKMFFRPRSSKRYPAEATSWQYSGTFAYNDSEKLLPIEYTWTFKDKHFGQLRSENQMKDPNFKNEFWTANIMGKRTFIATGQGDKFWGYSSLTTHDMLPGKKQPHKSYEWFTHKRRGETAKKLIIGNVFVDSLKNPVPRRTIVIRSQFAHFPKDEHSIRQSSAERIFLLPDDITLRLFGGRISRGKSHYENVWAGLNMNVTQPEEREISMTDEDKGKEISLLPNDKPDSSEWTVEEAWAESGLNVSPPKEAAISMTNKDIPHTALVSTGIKMSRVLFAAKPLVSEQYNYAQTAENRWDGLVRVADSIQVFPYEVSYTSDDPVLNGPRKEYYNYTDDNRMGDFKYLLAFQPPEEKSATKMTELKNLSESSLIGDNKDETNGNSLTANTFMLYGGIPFVFGIFAAVVVTALLTQRRGGGTRHYRSRKTRSGEKKSD